jgi:hypothetical protein
MTDVRTRLAEALGVIADQPGVQVNEPATPEMLDGAEERLGRPLPEHLRTLLSLSNGLSVQHGQRRILGVARTDSPDLIEFNRQDRWKYAWAMPELADCLVFGVTHILRFNAYRSDDVLLDGFLPLKDLERAGRDLPFKIERGWTTIATHPLHPKDAAVHRAVGTVPADQGIYLGPSYFLHGELAADELRLGPLEEILRMSGGLFADAASLPPNTTVVAPFKELDDQGRERWRWITDRDLPGLAEAAGPDGVVSHITIDGVLPGQDDAD